MNEVLLLYLFTRIDSIKHVIDGFVLFGIFGFFLFPIGSMIMHDEIRDYAKKWCKRFVAAIVIAASINVLIPTQKDLAIIVGGTVLVRAAQSDKAQEFGGLAYEAIRNKLKDIVDEQNKVKKDSK